jgi:hypothetical protein
MRLRWLTGALLLAAGLAALAGGPPAAKTVRQFARPAEVQGLSVVGRAEFYPDGALESATLAREAVFGDTRLPTRSILHLTPKGEPDWCFLPADTRLQGHTWQGGGDDWMTCFYPSGRVKSGGLAAEELIDGIPCDVGTFWTETFGGGGRTALHENGRLAFARVAREISVQSRRLKRGQHVRLDETGRLLDAR